MREAIPVHRDVQAATILEYLQILWPDRATRVLRGLFASGRIRSGGRPVGLDTPLRSVDDLTLEGSLADVPRLGPCEESGGIEIVFEDERLVALCKPSGVPVVPDPTRDGPSCLGWLVDRELGSRDDKAPQSFYRPRIVHRIDRLTSGLVLVARSLEVERRLASDLEGRRVRKEYLAIVTGEPAAPRITVVCPIGRGRKGKVRATVATGAAEAETVFESVRSHAGASLVRARPITGRTHQVRVHAWAAGIPLAIDPLYGSKAPPRALTHLPSGRLTLHAYRYGLDESWSEPREFHCAPPADFRDMLDTTGLA